MSIYLRRRHIDTTIGWPPPEPIYCSTCLERVDKRRGYFLTLFYADHDWARVWKIEHVSCALPDYDDEELMKSLAARFDDTRA